MNRHPMIRTVAAVIAVGDVGTVTLPLVAQTPPEAAASRARAAAPIPSRRSRSAARASSACSQPAASCGRNPTWAESTTSQLFHISCGS